jgi:hypothetical protein
MGGACDMGDREITDSRLYERGRRTKNSPMSHYKGRASRKTIEREFPHSVEIAVPPGGLGKRLDAMHAFHAERGISACLGRGRHEDNQDYLRWYFADAHTAASFAAEFGGTRC